MATPDDVYHTDQEIQMGETEDFLSHYGVKGMKWGVRRSQAELDRARARAGTVVLTKKCKNGTELTVREKPQGRVMKYLSSKSSAIAEAEAAYHEFTFHDKSGKTVGHAAFEQTSPTALGLEWIGINKKHRSNGYARAALEGVMEYAKNNGIEELNLTATDMGAPLYKSLGFKDLGDNDYQYKLPRSVKHSGDAPIDLLAEYIAASLDKYTEAELAKELDFESGSKQGGEDTATHDDTDDFLAHYGVKGMKWGVRRSQAQLDRAAGRRAAVQEAAINAKSKVFGAAVRFAPREHTYALRRALNNPSTDDKAIAKLGLQSTLANGVIPKNKRVTGAIEKVGIEKHKAATYDLDKTDLNRLKKYTDAAWYSRSVNSYLAIGKPPNFADRASELKDTLRKSRVNDTTVYRSTSLNFSFDGVAKKLESMSEAELAKSFDSFSKNYKGKTFKENRVFSTSTSPNFAIDTWREVNPNAAANYNTYMVINTKNTPGLLADGRTKKGGKIVNTRSNQEAILAPSKMKYESLRFDKDRGMFAITVTALGDDDD